MRSRSFGSILVPSVWALAACGGDDGSKPADAAVDSAPADASCTDYQGEIIDWNANSTNFCGVFHATATVRGQTSITGQTNPNGRFSLCLGPATTSVTVDITPPTDASQCSSAPGKYTHSATLTLLPSVISKPTLASIRLLSDSELATEYSIAGNGANYVATQGQLIVHIDGTPSRIKSLDGIDQTFCGMARQFNGAAWENVGSAAPRSDVLIPGCMLTNQQATVTSVLLEDGRSAQLTVEPNTFNYVTIPAS